MACTIAAPPCELETPIWFFGVRGGLGVFPRAESQENKVCVEGVGAVICPFFS